MVFGLKNLQDKVFCLTEERDFFQGKYLEQVSQIASLKEELRLARREIRKLRNEMMETSQRGVVTMTPPRNETKLDHSDQCSTTCSYSSLTNDSDREEESGSDSDEANDIRQSAEKLLQWASYRSSAYTARTPDQAGGSDEIASPTSPDYGGDDSESELSEQQPPVSSSGDKCEIKGDMQLKTRKNEESEIESQLVERFEEAAGVY